MRPSTSSRAEIARAELEALASRQENFSKYLIANLNVSPPKGACKIMGIDGKYFMRGNVELEAIWNQFAMLRIQMLTSHEVLLNSGQYFTSVLKNSQTCEQIYDYMKFFFIPNGQKSNEKNCERSQNLVKIVELSKIFILRKFCQKLYSNSAVKQKRHQNQVPICLTCVLFEFWHFATKT